MSAALDNFLLPTRRPPYTRAPSTGGDDFDTRSDASRLPLTTWTSVRSEIRTVSEQVSHRNIFLKLLFLWLGTILLTASVVGLVFGYQSKGVLTRAQKSTFTLLVTVLILILGLSFSVSYSSCNKHYENLTAIDLGSFQRAC